MMLNKINLKSVLSQSIFLFLITFLIGNMKDYLSFGISPYFVLSNIVTCIIVEVFAYITCWALVIKRGKSSNAIWINYIVWAIIMNAGNLSSIYDFI